MVRQGGDDASFTVDITHDATATFQWQVSEDSVTWTDLSNGGFYSGVTTKTLLLSVVDETIDGFQYRLIITTPALYCAATLASDAATLVAKDDSDGDDNVVCYDVLEAGHSDPDNDGILGTSPVTITPGVGLVEGEGGYNEVNMDMDDNGVYDFLEAGGPLTSITSPIYILTSQGTKVTFIAAGTAVSFVAYQWQVSTDDGSTWVNTVDGATYAGSQTSELVMDDVSTLLNANLYKAIISTPSYVCGDNDTTSNARLTVLPDNDGDGVQDIDDEDDDNDGILDSEEFIDDLDGDGIPNLFDLDSDGDGCNDVIEAGFLDPDNDGILGGSPVVVNPSNGRVISSTGYTDPDDLDGNLVSDYLEAGSQAVINSNLTELNEVSEFIANNKLKGEITLVIEGQSTQNTEQAQL